MVEYKHFSLRWRVLERYFSVPSLPDWANVRIIDSNEFVTTTEASSSIIPQMEWLTTACPENIGWHFLLGHHPSSSNGKHGNNDKVFDILHDFQSSCDIDIYFAGHDHHLEHIQGPGTFDVFINGGGGAKTKRVKTVSTTVIKNTSSLKEVTLTQKYAKATHGFMIVELSAEKLIVKIFDIHSLDFNEQTQKFANSVSQEDHVYTCQMLFSERQKGCIPL